jgi:putative ABC transport system ATP-binding protein
MQDPARGRSEPLAGPLVVQDLRIVDQHGQVVLDHLSLDTTLPHHIALLGEGPAASALARVIARRMEPAHGRLQLADLDLTRLPEAVSGRRMAYAGPDPVLFPGSIRDNLVYGLRRAPREAGDPDDPESRRRVAEARATGNPVDDPDADWIDYAAAGAGDPLSLDLALVRALELTGMGADVYRFGLSGRIDAVADAGLRERIVGARHRLRERLESEGMARLVEPFDPRRYNLQATLGENILFGVPLSGPLRNGRLTADPDFARAIKETGLSDVLVDLGLRIAQTMTEIFRGLAAGDPLFEEFSFISADDLPDFTDMLRKVSLRGPSALTLPERLRVMSVPLDYIEPRHRLGLIDEATVATALAARARFRELARASGSVAFYEPDDVCEAAPLRDNLLFGRVAHGLADAEARVTAAMTRLIEELGLREEVERLGLAYQVGPSGRLLTPTQRVRVHLARCLVKRPDIMVLDGACVALGEREGERILRLLLDHLRGRTLIAVLRDDALTEHFDSLIEFEGPHARIVRVAQVPHHQPTEDLQA